MKVHEYQAKQIMSSRGIPVPIGRMATTVEDAVAAVRPLIEESGNPVVVLKSQIHAGGRGKGTFQEHPDLRGVNVITDGVEGGPEAAEAKTTRGADLIAALEASLASSRGGAGVAHGKAGKNGHAHRRRKSA